VKVLIACEESQIVLHEFFIRGHDVWSCDLQDTSGDYPSRHIKSDVLEVIGDSWDMMIGHPVCTRMARSGVRWLEGNPERWADMKLDAEFFLKLWNSNIPQIALENALPHKYAIDLIGTTYSQLIQPYNFGVAETKSTCLWLKNLPPLMFTSDARHAMNSCPFLTASISTTALLIRLSLKPYFFCKQSTNGFIGLSKSDPALENPHIISICSNPSGISIGRNR